MVSFLPVTHRHWGTTQSAGLLVTTLLTLAAGALPGDTPAGASVRSKPMDRGGRQDGNKEASGPRYLRVVDVIRSLQPLLQHIPVSHHAAADCTRQVALAVQVTCEEAHEGIRRQGTAQVVDKAHTENHSTSHSLQKAGSHRDQQQRPPHCYTSPRCVR